jgi:hypothetical protein
MASEGELEFEGAWSWLFFGGVVMLITQTFFFGFGWIFYMRRLFKDYEVRCLGEYYNTIYSR